MQDRFYGMVSIAIALLVFVSFFFHLHAEWMFGIPMAAMIVGGIGVMKATNRAPVLSGFGVLFSALSAVALLVALGMAA